MKKRPNYLECRGESWDKARMRVLVRDDFTCQFSQLGLHPVEGCTQASPETRLRKLHVHHKQQRIHGGTHDLENLITICGAHHEQIHPHMRFDLSAGNERIIDLDMREL